MSSGVAPASSLTLLKGPFQEVSCLINALV